MARGSVSDAVSGVSGSQDREQQTTEFNAKATEFYSGKKTAKNAEKIQKAQQKAEEAFQKKLDKEKLKANQKMAQEMLDAFTEGATTASEQLKAGLIKGLEKVGGFSVSEHQGESFGDQLKANLAETTGKMAEKFVDAMNAMSVKVNQAAETIANYQSSWNARLQGTNKTFQNIEKLTLKNLGVSPYVKQEDMLSSLNDLIDEGITYNLEQRAFLATISDKIATTFDVANGTLLRLIRIQQADSTQARLGMEAYLTQFLNSTFQDTSYLKNTADSISSSLLGVSSQLNRDDAFELEFIVQKWLGSLGSVGVGDSTLTMLAEGINALGTGDISKLSSNAALQNLFVMGANRANIAYSDILTQGLKADTANALMKGVVTYLQSLAGTDNQVIKSTYANIFGTTVEDLNAILNIVNDIDSITKSTLNYSGAVKELTNQIAQIPSRMHIGEMIGNLFSNATQGIAMNIANNPFLYTTWLINDLIEGATGGINIPFISAFGTGVDLNANINQIARLGIVGIGALGQIGNIIAGLGSGGGLNLNSWGFEETTSRGTGFRGIKTGAQVGSSQITYVGSSSGSDAYSSSLMSAYEQTDEATNITGQDTEDKITPAIVDSMKPNIETITQHIATIDENVRRIANALINPSVMIGGFNTNITDGGSFVGV